MAGKIDKDRINMWLSISISAFILLWLSAMQLVSFFDSLPLFVIIVCSVIGAIRGGIREIFGFFGAIASIVIALSTYRWCYHQSHFDFATGQAEWGQIGWFLVLLASSWLIFFLAGWWLEKKISHFPGLQVFNCLLGSLIAGVKGAVVAGLSCVLVMALFVDFQIVEQEFRFSYISRLVNLMEKRYHIMEDLYRIDVVRKFREKRWSQVAKKLFPDDDRLCERTNGFLLWLAANPSRWQRLGQSSQAGKFFAKFLEIPEVRRFWLKDIDLKLLRTEPRITSSQIYIILNKPATRELARQNSVRELVRAAKFTKIKSQVE